VSAVNSQLCADYLVCRLSVHSYLLHKCDTCRLGFCPLSMLYCSLWWGELGFRGSTKDMFQQHLSLLLVLYSLYWWLGGEVCSSGHGGGGGRGDAAGAWSFSNISVLQSILLRCTACLLGEGDS
jgi:hypothetical protein